MSAASRVAGSYGFVAEDPVVLQETNNTVVWLRPHAIIAKVGRCRRKAAPLMREHAVAISLAANNAPIAPPVKDASPTRDEETGYMVTLWHRLDHDPERTIPPTLLGESLRQLHQHLAHYESLLPSFLDKIRLARDALGNDRIMAALGEEDRSMLRGSLDQLVADLEGYSFTERNLHGEPHDRNLLVTQGGPRWIDLEGACFGPVEWDLAFLPDDAVAVFPSVDRDLLVLLQTLNSARVATWCWARADLKEMRGHGEYHLEVVRRQRRHFL